MNITRRNIIGFIICVLFCVSIGTLCNQDMLNAELEPKEDIIATKKVKSNKTPILYQKMESNYIANGSISEGNGDILNEEFDKDEHLLLATLIYFESGGSVEGGCAVGWTVINRLNAPQLWGDDTLKSVIYHTGQFTVVGNKGTSRRKNFESKIKNILNEDTDKAINALTASEYVLTNRDEYKIPSHVTHFHGNEDKRKWGNLIFYKEINGNTFFSDRRLIN